MSDILITFSIYYISNQFEMIDYNLYRQIIIILSI